MYQLYQHIASRSKGGVYPTRDAEKPKPGAGGPAAKELTKEENMTFWLSPMRSPVEICHTR